MALRLIFSHAPTSSSRCRIQSTMTPSAVGPTLSSRLPFLLTMSTSSWTSFTEDLTLVRSSPVTYPQPLPIVRQASHGFGLSAYDGLSDSMVLKSACEATNRSLTITSLGVGRLTALL